MSFADAMIRACNGISSIVASLNEASSSIRRSRDTIRNVQSALESLRLFVTEYKSSKVFVEHHQLLPDIVKKELLAIHSELVLLEQMILRQSKER